MLFEPRSKLSDSVTYDITAWSLPFVHGAQTYAVKDKLVTGTYSGNRKVAAIADNVYGYLVNYSSFADVKFLSAMLNAGLKLRYAEKEFVYNGKTFQKGTIIVLRKSNEDKLTLFANLAQAGNADVTPVHGGFMETGMDFGSDKVHYIKNQGWLC